MSKLIRQVCSVLLTLSIIIHMIPLNVFALEASEGTPASTAIGSMAEQSGSAGLSDSVEVLGEDLSKRSEFYKEFILDNGLRLAAIYPTAVHYRQDGRWEEIDNTLSAETVGTQAVYTNTAGPWEVRFPQQLSGSNAISLTKDGYTVSFAMAGQLRSGGGLSVAAAGASAAQTVALSNSSAAQIQQVDTTALKAAAEFGEAIPDKLYARILYGAVYDDTNVVYDLDGGQLKESIVIRSYDAALRGYRYELDTGGLAPVLNEDQSIDLLDPITGDVVMTMPAPFLLDAEDISCDDVQVSLIQKGSVYLLCYQLPTDWLAETDRAWPVILDPVVSANNDRTNIQDITVAENATESNNATTIKCGYHLTKGILRTYLRFKELPSLTSSDVIVKATVSLIKPYDSTLSAPIEVHKVNAPWQASETSWSNMPGFDTGIEDITVVQDPATYSWDITEIAQGWYADTANTLLNNTGMMFKATDAIETAGEKNWQQFCSSDFGSDRPILTIQYLSAAGLEDYWDATSGSAGRAGTGYIQNYSGNLVWVHSDMGFGGSRMPVSISHVYNASAAWDPDTGTGSDLFGLGNGWRTNFNQRILVLPDTGYVWEDGDGTRHEFAMTTLAVYKDKDDLGLTLTVSDTGYTLTDKYGNTSLFDATGRLTRQTDNQSVPSSVSISYQGTSFLISQILDGVGREYAFTYGSDGLLEDITYYGGGTTVLLQVSYEYIDSELIAITYEDDRVAYFEYTDKSLLSSVTDIDGYTLSYSYNTLESGKPSRVASVSESCGGVSGGSTTIRYAWNHTALTDHNGNSQTHFFNIWGNTISVQNSEGQAVFSTYATDENQYADRNRLRESSQQQNTVANMIRDASFESGTVWSSSSATVTLSEDQAYYGTRSLKSTTGNPAVVGPTSGGYTALAGETYTFSAYVKVISGAVQLVINAGGATATSQVLSSGSDWTRLEVTVTNNATSSQTLSVCLFHVTTGTAYIDCVQLENAHSASRYNLIENGDFRYGQDWTFSSGAGTTGHQSAPKLSGSMACINGNTAEVRYITQTVPLSGEAGDLYVFGGWVKGDSLAIKGDRTFRLLLTFNNTDGTTTDVALNFNEHLSDGQWQYAARSATAGSAYSSITVRAEYAYNANTVYFDGIQLYKEGFGTRYAYDYYGNVTQTRDILGQITNYTYDSNNDLTKIVYPTKAEVVNTYDNRHNLLTATQYVWVEDEENAEGGTLTQTTVTTYDYDDWGNLEQTTVKYEGSDESEQDVSMITKSSYTADGNYLATTTDELGNITTYEYDPQTGVLLSVELPEETLTSKTTYTYDEMYRLETVSEGTGENAMTASYTYLHDRLSGISKFGTEYALTYDGCNDLTKISIGTRTLASYAYTNDQNRYLSTLSYGNGDVVKYTYDDLGRVTKEDYYENGSSTASRTVTYAYNESGGLAKVTDSKTGTTTTYSYDSLGRLSFTHKTDGSSFEDARYCYDSMGDLLLEKNWIQSTLYQTLYYYDSLRRVAKVENGDLSTEYTYDIFSRLAQKTTSVDENTIIEEYINYQAPSDGTTSDRISVFWTLTDDDCVYYLYDYDQNGNIIGEVRVTGNRNADTEDLPVSTAKKFFTGYAYNRRNQLYRENNQQAGKTWVWTYDAAGNITSKKEYDYDDVDDDPLNTITYTYADSSWGDLLTSYNGKAITYDGIGNPLTDGTWTYTWEQGRQLTKMQSSSATWTYSYGTDGLRTGRTDGTTGNTYRYWYNDSGLLLRMEKGNTVYSFTYDPAGRPVSVTQGNTRYYYVLNQQGDVVGLIDSNKTLVVEYCYDAWGRILSTTGSMASTLGTNNPLRYRGYIYDTETGLYYLQSRYYNPAWGRFINADDPGYMGIDGTPISYNLFAYCGNNPVTRADDNGEFFHLVVGAFFGVVTQYVSDVVANLMDGDSFLEALVPSSSWVDYGAAALSGAVGATGIGFWGSVAANAGISGGQYLANCAIEGKTPDIDQLGFEVGFGAFSGMIGGKGADGANLLGIYKTSKHILKTAVSPKKIAMYTAKCATVRNKAIDSVLYSLVIGLCSEKIEDQYENLVSALW